MMLQCKRCWDHHNERTCTRKLRCRLCGSKEHTETGHTHNGPSAPDCNCPSRCTNCGGPTRPTTLDAPSAHTMKGTSYNARRRHRRRQFGRLRVRLSTKLMASHCKKASTPSRSVNPR